MKTVIDTAQDLIENRRIEADIENIKTCPPIANSERRRWRLDKLIKKSEQVWFKSYRRLVLHTAELSPPNLWVKKIYEVYETQIAPDSIICPEEAQMILRDWLCDAFYWIKVVFAHLEKCDNCQLHNFILLHHEWTQKTYL